MNLEYATSTLVALMLGSIRAIAFLVVTPPFNTKSIPAQTKALLGVGLALPMTNLLSGQIDDLSTPALLVAAVEQVVIGAAIGFLTLLIFSAVQAAGDMIDLFGGFSVAFQFDPMSFTGGNSVFGKLYGMIATTLLFATDGHILVMRGFAQSYRLLPLDGTLSLATLNRLLTGGMTQLFLVALQIAGPLIAVLFCTDIGLGLLSRAAPALNVFQLGFPAKIGITLLLSGVAILVLPQAVDSLVQTAVRQIVGLVGG